MIRARPAAPERMALTVRPAVRHMRLLSAQIPLEDSLQENSTKEMESVRVLAFTQTVQIHQTDARPPRNKPRAPPLVL
jgi:predicted nucleotidyltransferase